MKFINIHCHISENNTNCIEIINQYPTEFNKLSPFFSIGIHPWYLEKSDIENDLKIIEEKISQQTCMAIGECGLDKRIDVSLDFQLEVLEKQLLLAKKYNKPVILHCVGAYQELIDIKNRLQIETPMIIHGFSKNLTLALQLIKNGFYLSFGKYLILNPKLEKTFMNIPNDRFFLETDSSNYSIEAIYNLAKKYKNLDLQELQIQLELNFNRVFKIQNN